MDEETLEDTLLGEPCDDDDIDDDLAEQLLSDDSGSKDFFSSSLTINATKCYLPSVVKSKEIALKSLVDSSVAIALGNEANLEPVTGSGERVEINSALNAAAINESYKDGPDTVAQQKESNDGIASEEIPSIANIPVVAVESNTFSGADSKSVSKSTSTDVVLISNSSVDPPVTGTSVDAFESKGGTAASDISVVKIVKSAGAVNSGVASTSTTDNSKATNSSVASVVTITIESSASELSEDNDENPADRRSGTKSSSPLTVTNHPSCPTSSETLTLTNKITGAKLSSACSTSVVTRFSAPFSNTSETGIFNAKPVAISTPLSTSEPEKKPVIDGLIASAIKPLEGASDVLNKHEITDNADETKFLLENHSDQKIGTDYSLAVRFEISEEEEKSLLGDVDDDIDLATVDESVLFDSKQDFEDYLKLKEELSRISTSNVESSKHTIPELEKTIRPLSPEPVDLDFEDEFTIIDEVIDENDVVIIEPDAAITEEIEAIKNKQKSMLETLSEDDKEKLKKKMSSQTYRQTEVLELDSLPENYLLSVDNAVISHVKRRWGRPVPSPEINLSYLGYGYKVARCLDEPNVDAAFQTCESLSVGNKRKADFELDENQPKKARTDEALVMAGSGNQRKAFNPEKQDADSIDSDIEKGIHLTLRELYHEYQESVQKLRADFQDRLVTMTTRHQKETQNLKMGMLYELHMAKLNGNMAKCSHVMRESRNLQYYLSQQHDLERAMLQNVAVDYNKQIKDLFAEYTENKDKVQQASRMQANACKEFGRPPQRLIAVKLRYCMCRGRQKSSVFLPEDVARAIMDEDELYDHFYQYEDEPR